MRFFDCNACIGLPRNAGPARCVSAEGLLAEMDRAGIEQALVWHVAQADYDAIAGNELLGRAIAPHARLVGCWSILPNQTGELGDLDEFFRSAAAARVRAFRATPNLHGYALRREALGEVLERMLAAGLPLVLPVRRGADWNALYDLLADLPELTVILADVGWATERLWRPLVGQYPNCYVETSSYFVAGGIETFVRDFGPRRLLFGTGFPEAYPGAAMLALKGAAIPDEAKGAIAGDNLRRLLEGVRA